MTPEMYLAFGLGFVTIGLLVSKGIMKGKFDLEIKVQHKGRRKK